jgi:hypothetical protein
VGKDLATRRSSGVAFHERIKASRRPLLLVLPAILVVGLLMLRPPLATRPAFGSGGLPTDPATLLSDASTKIAARTAKSGAGFTFAVEQRTSIDQRAGGPAVEIPDPADRHKSLGTTDHLEVASLIAQGAVRADGSYWLEMRDGPAPGGTPDYNAATYRFGALVIGGKLYRNDGDGWYATSNLPGIGLDPKTIALLPTMLKGVANASLMSEGKNLAAAAVAGVRGNSTAAAIPGLIAPDAVAFTELNQPLDIGFDGQGRLASIHAIARNTNLDGFDMLVETTITFSYPLLAPDIPNAEPLIDPNAAAKAKG